MRKCQRVWLRHRRMIQKIFLFPKKIQEAFQGDEVECIILEISEADAAKKEDRKALLSLER